MLRKRTVAAVNLQLDAAIKSRSTLHAMLASHTDPKDIAETKEYIAAKDLYIAALLENRDRIVARNLANFRKEEKDILARLRGPGLTDDERDELTLALETVGDRIVALLI
jgi:hypothetical protein